jgi:zinc protease
MNMKRIGSLLNVVAALTLVALAATAAAPQPAPTPQSRPIDRLVFPKLHDIKTPPVVRETLANGLKLLLIEDHDLPQVSFRAIVRGGQIAEPAGKAGLAELFGDVHRSGGTATMTGDEIDNLLDNLGAEIQTGVAEAYGFVSGKTLAENLNKVLPVFSHILTSPVFAQEKIDLGKTHLRSIIARRNDNVMEIAFREIQKLVYGARSPYARQFEYEDVDGLTRDDLVGFHETYYRPDATILAVWGDFNANEMKVLLEKTFGGWKSEGAAPKIAMPAVAPQKPVLGYIEKKDVEQTSIIAGQLGLRLDDPDYPAIYVMNEILGGGFASRIFVKVRTEKGLAYAAGGSVVPAYDHLGLFYFYTATKPSTTTEALAAMLGEIKKIREAPVTDDELKRAKDGYLNSYAFEFDSTGKIVNRLASYDFYGYPEDFNVRLRDAVEKVTKDDVLRSAKKHLNPEALAIIAIGRQEQFDKPLSTFGEVTPIDITIPEPESKEKTVGATPESLERGKQLLMNVAKAVGEDVLSNLTDIYAEGVTQAATPMGDMELKGKVTFVLPNRLHSEIEAPMGVMVQVLDGERAWMTMGGMSQDLPESVAADMLRGLSTRNGCLLILKNALEGKIAAQAVGRTQFEGREVEDVLVSLDDRPAHIYIALDAGEILGTKRTAQTQEGPAEMIELFAGYKEGSGLRLPFESKQKVNGEVKASTNLSAVKINAGFSEDIFRNR